MFVSHSIIISLLACFFLPLVLVSPDTSRHPRVSFMPVHDYDCLWILPSPPLFSSSFFFFLSCCCCCGQAKKQRSFSTLPFPESSDLSVFLCLISGSVICLFDWHRCHCDGHCARIAYFLSAGLFAFLLFAACLPRPSPTFPTSLLSFVVLLALLKQSTTTTTTTTTTNTALTFCV